MKLYSILKDGYVINILSNERTAKDYARKFGALVIIEFEALVYLDVQDLHVTAVVYYNSLCGRFCRTDDPETIQRYLPWDIEKQGRKHNSIDL